jgi:23S rRNA pseudouridine2457 synthase
MLCDGVLIDGRKTLPTRARRIHNDIPPRNPPIRVRRNIPTSWIELTLHEGRNRQVRRMTASVGHPTLRLIRVRIGRFDLPPDLAPGRWRELGTSERDAVLSADQRRGASACAEELPAD